MRKPDSSWVRYIKQRITKNKNFLAIISGPTGSGKSWSALSIAEQVDDYFDETRVIFRGKDLMNLMNYGNLPKGACIIWDETQIDLSNRNWQSVTNKMLNFLLSTFRHRNFILLFTAPYADFLDSSTLKLFHANFETQYIDRRTSSVVLKPKLLQYNPDLKKWYKKYLRVSKVGQGGFKIKKWKVRKPSELLVKGYEKKKKVFTDKLNRDISDKLESLDSLGETKKPLTELQANIVECWKQGMFKQKDIAATLGKEQKHISSVEGSLFRKGYQKERYRLDFASNPLEKPQPKFKYSTMVVDEQKNKGRLFL